MRKELKDFFIPHEGNNFKPHSLQKAAILGMFVLVVLSFTLANLQSLIWISSDWMVSTILPSVIVELTNGEREDGQLTDLRRSEVLDKAAKMKAEHMAANEYFAHYSPEGISPWYWFDTADYHYVHAGENLAIHFTDSGEVVKAWMDSPTHRDNIMNGNFTEIGIGTAEGYFEGHKTVYVVQLFGTPAAVPSAVEIVAALPEEQAESEELPTTTEVALLDEENLAEETTEETLTTTPRIAGSEENVEVVDDVATMTPDTIEAVAEVTGSAPTSSESTDASSTEIAKIDVTKDVISLYLYDVSTSTGGIPARIETTTVAGSTGESVGIVGALTRPQLVLQGLYTLIAFFVVVALALALFIEIRRQHPVQIVYSAGLSAAMFALFYLHIVLTSGALIV